MSDVLNCEIREKLGTAASRRLRDRGRIPANLYGHGEGNLNLVVAGDEVQAILRHGGRVVELRGAVNENALVREVQWDAFGVDILHLDLTRVSARERVEVSVKVELRGVAPGTREGGNIEHQTHEITIECPAMEIPERFEVSINQLHLNESILVKDIELPGSAKLLSDPDEVVVTCHEVVTTEEVEVGEAATEPELIRRREEEEESEEG